MTLVDQFQGQDCELCVSLGLLVAQGILSDKQRLKRMKLWLYRQADVGLPAQVRALS